MRGIRTGQTPRIRELLAAGQKPGDVAIAVGCSRERVYQVRRMMDLPPLATSALRSDAGSSSAEARRGRGRAMHAAEPEDAASPVHIATLTRPFVADGAVDEIIQLDGGDLAIEPAGMGLALLTLHEKRQGSAVVRVDRAQLSTIIERLTAARDALPVVGMRRSA